MVPLHRHPWANSLGLGGRLVYTNSAPVERFPVRLGRFPNVRVTRSAVLAIFKPPGYAFLKLAAVLFSLAPLAASGAQSADAVDLTAESVKPRNQLRQVFESPRDQLRLAVRMPDGTSLTLDLQSYKPFAPTSRVFLDGQKLDPSASGTQAHYYRGNVEGEAGTYAFIGIDTEGTAELHIDRFGAEYRGSMVGQELRLVRAQRASNSVDIDWPATDVVKPPLLEPPSGPSAAQLASQPTGNRSARAESIGVSAGWYGPFSLTVPAGQAYVGAVSRGPGIANSYLVTAGESPTEQSYCEDSKCFIENPAAGDYDIYVYKFDSSSAGWVPDLPSEVNFGYGAELAEGELYSATLAIELDSALYSQMGESVEAVTTYLAQLVSYVSVTYEEELNTRLLVGDRVLWSQAQDPYTANPGSTGARLDEVRPYWRDNFDEIERALAVHLTTSEIGGGIATLDMLCDDAYGYSVSGVDATSPSDAGQINWDAEVLAHELGHNFSSPHTHCYNGLGGNSNPVDGCYNGEASDGCWAGSESLPGVGSLAGGNVGAQNGTIMSYCHLLDGGLNNIARTFGSNTSFGIEAGRVSAQLSRRTAQIAAASSECLAVVDEEETVSAPGKPSISGITSGDGTLSVAFDAGAGDAPDAYTVTCVDQGVARRSDSPFSAASEGLVTTHDAPVEIQGNAYSSLQEFHNSQAFREGGHRCGTEQMLERRRGMDPSLAAISSADCTSSNTSIEDEYTPLASGAYVIPVYWHVISTSAGVGNVSEQNILDQMEVLNEDFAAVFDTTIEFELVDITRTVNDDWFSDSLNDETAYKDALKQDPSQYLNIYTNDASGYLGYAYFPSDMAGSLYDGVVMNHAVVGGRDLQGAAPYDQGRTLVHEIGHYLGLYHTFQGDGGQCANSFTSGDYIVDTNPHDTEDYGTSASFVCGGNTPIENFMNYSDDIAMDRFTEQQSNRMVCGLQNYRSDAYAIRTTTFIETGASSPITLSGLSNGNTYSCSVVASNSAGSSAASDAVTAIPGTSVPAAPDVIRTDYGDGEIYLFVTVSDDGGSSVTGYTASCTDGSTTYTGTSADSPITVSGLNNDMAYTCTVTATNANGTSAASSATASITPEEGATGLPIWLLYQATQ